MQIEHDVGIDGQGQQFVLQVLGGRVRGQGCHRIAQGLADQIRVVVLVRAQALAYRVAHRGRQFGIAAVEIAAIAQIKATLVLTQHGLPQANRVGIRAPE